MEYARTSRLVEIALIAAAVSISLGVAAVYSQPTPTASTQSAPVEMKNTLPPAASVVRVEPGQLLVTKSIAPLDDGSQRALITSTITNRPIPDSVEARQAYGGPDSAAGKATAPHPGPAGKVLNDEPTTPAPK